MQYILYFLIAIGATTVGSMTGMGGGVIIKPLMDVIQGVDVETIGVLSSITVFCMSVVSIGKHIQFHCVLEGQRGEILLQDLEPSIHSGGNRHGEHIVAVGREPVRVEADGLVDEFIHAAAVVRFVPLLDFLPGLRLRPVGQALFAFTHIFHSNLR